MAVLSKRAWWFWPWVVICGVLFFSAAMPDVAHRLPRFGLCVLALLGLYLAMNAYEKRVEKQQMDVDRLLLQEFLIAIRSGNDVRFKASLFLSAGLVAVTFCFSLALCTAKSIGAVFFGMALFCVPLLLGLNLWMRLGKPALIVSIRGIQAHIGCLVPWPDISGISLEEQRSRGMVVGYKLTFKVDNLPNRIGEMTFAARCYYRLFSKAPGARQVSVDLYSPSESPTLIRDLCVTLWTRVTGKENVWHTGMSEDMHAALSAVDDWSREASGPYSESALNDKVALANEGMQRYRHAHQVFSQELSRATHWSNGGKIPAWVAALVIGMVLAGLCLAFYYS